MAVKRVCFRSVYRGRVDDVSSAGRARVERPRLRGLRVAALLTVLVTACSPRHTANQEVATSTPSAIPTANRLLISTARPSFAAAARSIGVAVNGLQSSYVRRDWSAVRAEFASDTAASDLLGTMQRWQGEQVHGLKVTLVYVHPLRPGRYEATVQFAVDDRAVPDYAFYVFTVRRGSAQISGTLASLLSTSSSTFRWKVSRSAHFVVYHSAYQLEALDRHYLADLEHQRAEFASKFHVRLPRLARFYLYPDAESMSRLTRGVCGSKPGEVGCTQPFQRPPLIQAVIRATFHEPIHVYELALEPRPRFNQGILYTQVAPLFIAEGTAVALEDRDADPTLSDYCSDLAYAPLDECARIALQQVKPDTILSDAGFKKVDAGDAYSLGGSFVKYLILKYGYRRFGRFYYALAAQPRDRRADYDAASMFVYRMPMQQLLQAWSKGLCPNGC